jgi:hypothetical protein
MKEWTVEFGSKVIHVDDTAEDAINDLEIGYDPDDDFMRRKNDLSYLLYNHS